MRDRSEGTGGSVKKMRPRGLRCDGERSLKKSDKQSGKEATTKGAYEKNTRAWRRAARNHDTPFGMSKETQR